jgi:hypothetical protein
VFGAFAEMAGVGYDRDFRRRAKIVKEIGVMVARRRRTLWRAGDFAVA